MEIHNNYSKKNFFKRLKNRIASKRIITILFYLIAICGFGFGCIVYGAYLNKTSQTSVLRMFLVRISEFDFSFIPNHFKGQTADIDQLTIDITFKNLEKIRFFRERALTRGRIFEIDQEEVPARINYNGNSYRVDISLTGLLPAHIRHPNQWSLAVNVKDGETIMGMKRFALLFTQSRGYLTDWIATKLLKAKDVIGIRNDFVRVVINGKNNGIYYLEERYDKRLIENNQFREGIIFQFNEVDFGIELYGEKTIMEIPELAEQLAKLKKLWYLFLNDKIAPEEIFDLKKMASIFVVSDLINGKHAYFLMNMRLYFNPHTSLIEPIGREWGYFRNETYSEPSFSISKADTPEQVALNESAILTSIVSSVIFQEEYLRQMQQYTNRNYLDSIINVNKAELESLLSKIYLQNPFYKFPIDLLYKNKNLLRGKLSPNSPFIEASFVSLKDESLMIKFHNLLELPVEIHGVSYNGKLLRKLNRVIVDPFSPSRNAEISANFIFDPQADIKNFSVDSLEVSYSVLGINNKKKAIVFPKEILLSDATGINPTKKVPNYTKFAFLEEDKGDGHLIFKKGKCEIREDLIIPEGYIISANPGCEIDLLNSSKIISYSPFRMFGEPDNLITILSSDSTGQGIVVFNCDEFSEFSHVNFINLSNIDEDGWDLTGAITFYEAPVNFNYCTFKNNLRGDDFINIIRSDFNITNTLFEGSFADAVDADFCTGFISDVVFKNPGNDAIDVSGTKISVKKVKILNPGDKGLSGGENSHLICEDILVEGGEIAVASKDNSIIEIDRIHVSSSKLAFCAYQKKSEYGPGKIIVRNATSEHVQTEYLIELSSTLFLNDEEIKIKTNNVGDKLYGVEYGKSSR